MTLGPIVVIEAFNNEARYITRSSDIDFEGILQMAELDHVAVNISKVKGGSFRIEVPYGDIKELIQERHLMKPLIDAFKLAEAEHKADPLKQTAPQTLATNKDMRVQIIPG